ncbi:hypothetical protein J6590_025147 [Homalodisca vitripennis]|nr:hypothetical protein J6590_025147 [Homalodisca vitripennis]
MPYILNRVSYECIGAQQTDESSIMHSKLVHIVSGCSIVHHYGFWCLSPNVEYAVGFYDSTMPVEVRCGGGEVRLASAQVERWVSSKCSCLVSPFVVMSTCCVSCRLPDFLYLSYPLSESYLLMVWLNHREIG